MENFWHLNFGNIITILVLVAGVIGFAYTMRTEVKNLTTRLLEVEEQLKKMVEVLITLGRQDERLKLLNERLLSQGKRLDEAERRVNRYMDLKITHLERVISNNNDNGN